MKKTERNLLQPEEKRTTSVSSPQLGVLLIGNFFTGRSGTWGVGQDLAIALKTAGWSVLTASSRPGRVARLLDFLLTVWRRRDRYHVAHVDVSNGRAFI